MKRNDDMHRVRLWTLSLGLALSCGCGGALRAAAVEHAQASLAVAQTLKRAVAGLHCDGGKDDAASPCKVSVGVIEEQAQALQDSAARLQRTAR